ncbi:DgyrCDS3837 [Dimorphilus gyrociliatus]|uniref:DgyrCDS3837 n=1 Tax=Dimorphilus gyrociliatus TaxID=2664684 RepID=A0A7I8VF54_9ANNE|nr:DgyrCDS3837 [Dimorphilus gyrociliatus]
MDNLEKRLKSYEAELETSGKKIRGLLEEKEDLGKEIQDLENRLRIVREEHEKEAEEKNYEIDQLKKSLQESQIEFQALKQTLSGMESSASDKFTREFVEDAQEISQQVLPEQECLIEDTSKPQAKWDRLSELLAESVQNIISVEDTINKVLSRARKNEEDHSFLFDEGLDLTQKLSESVFSGGEMASDVEQIVQDSGSHLTMAIGRLVALYNDSESSLMQQVKTARNFSQQVERLKEALNETELRAKELEEERNQLSISLLEANQLSNDKDEKLLQIEETLKLINEERDLAVSDLEKVSGRLEELLRERAEFEEKKQMFYLQQKVMEENATDEERGLLNAFNRLVEETQEKEVDYQRSRNELENRIKELEIMVDEMQANFDHILIEKTNEIDDLNKQLDAKDKQLHSSTKFMKDQADEREQEREDYEEEISKLENSLRDHERSNSSQDSLLKEIRDLEGQINEYKTKDLENKETTNQLKLELQKAIENLQEQRDMHRVLEEELDSASKNEHILKDKICLLQDELERAQLKTEPIKNSFEEENKLSPSPQQERILSELQNELETAKRSEESALKRLKELEDELKVARNNEKILSADKDALHHQLLSNMSAMSELKSQVDDLRVGFVNRDSMTEENRNLKADLLKEREESMIKQNYLDQLESKVKELESSLGGKEERFQEILKLSEKSVIDLQQNKNQLLDKIESLETDNEDLERQMRSLKESSTLPDLTQKLLDEKNQEIDELREDINNLNETRKEAENQLVQKKDKEIEDLRLQIKEMQNSIAKVETYKKESTELKEKLIEMEELRIYLQENEKERTVLIEKTNQIDKLLLSLQELKKENLKLKEKIFEIEELKLLNTETKKENLLLKENVAKLTDMKITIKECEVENNELKMRLTEMKEVEVELQNREIKLQELMERIDKIKAEKSQELTKAKDAIIEIKIQYDNTIKRSSELEEELQFTQNCLKEKEITLNNVMKELEATRPSIVGAGSGDASNMQELQSQLKFLQNDLNGKRTRVASLEEELDEASNTIRDLKNQLGSTTTACDIEFELESIKNDLKNKEENICKIEQDNLEANNIIKELTEELDLARISTLNLSDEMQSLLEVERHKVLLLQKENSTLKENLVDLKNELEYVKSSNLKDSGIDEDTQTRLLTLEKERDEAIIKIRNLEAELEVFKDDLESQKFDKENALEELSFTKNSELEELKQDLDEAKAEILLLKASQNSNHSEHIRIDKHVRELDGIKSVYEQELSEARFKVNQLEKLVEANRENEQTRSDISRCLSKELDQSLSLDAQLQDYLSIDSRDADENESVEDDELDSKLQKVLNKLMSHSVKVLTLSEIEFISKQNSDSVVNGIKKLEMNENVTENHVDGLISAVDSLRETLEDLKSDNQQNDWRMEIIRKIYEIIIAEKRILRKELLAFSRPTQLIELERRLNNTITDHNKVINDLKSTDRKSLLDEIDAIQLKLTDYEEKEKDEMTREISQLRRQLKLTEYKADQEKVQTEDIRLTLAEEKSKNRDISVQFFAAQSELTDLKSQYNNCKNELMRIRDTLELEEGKVVTATSILEQLLNSLERERNHVRELETLLQTEKDNVDKFSLELNEEKENSKRETERLLANFESLQKEIENEKMERKDTENRLYKEKNQVELLKRDLENEKDQLRALHNRYSSQLNDSKKNIEDLRRALEECQGTLNKERSLTIQYKESLAEERSTRRRLSDRETIVSEELKTSLELQKAKVEKLERENNNLRDSQSRQQELISKLKFTQDELRRRPPTIEIEKLRHRIIELEAQSPAAYKKRLSTTKEQIRTLLNRSEVSPDPNIKNMAQDLMDVLQDLQKIEADVHDLGSIDDTVDSSLIEVNEATARLIRELKEEVKDKDEELHRFKKRYRSQLTDTERSKLENEIVMLRRELHIVKKQLHHCEHQMEKQKKSDPVVFRRKIRDVHFKYLKAESLRKSLVYQKKYLLLMLGGYQETEEETLRILATMGGRPDKKTLVSKQISPRHRFKSIVCAVCAIWRLKFYVRHWKKTTRNEGQALSSANNGYIPVSNRYEDGEVCSTSSSTPTISSYQTDEEMHSYLIRLEKLQKKLQPVL